MKKTTLISILVVAVQLGIAVIAEAQQAGKVPRLGYVSVRGASSQAPVLEAFRQGLRELGYILPVEQPTKFDLVINLKAGQTDRPDNSAQRAGKSGQSN